MQKMSKHWGCGALVLIIALWWAAPTPVHALPFTPAVEYASFGGFSHDFSGTIGSLFTTSVPLNVDALAYWDTVPDLGNSVNHQVGIWDFGNPTPLVSTTVLTTDPIQGHFQYHSIPTFTLAPGSYVIGGEAGGLSYGAFANGGVSVTGYTHNAAAVDSSNGAGLNYPSTFITPNAYGQFSILAPNFSIASAVPESSTILLLAAGLAGIIGYGWRRKHAA